MTASFFFFFKFQTTAVYLQGIVSLEIFSAWGSIGLKACHRHSHFLLKFVFSERFFFVCVSAGRKAENRIRECLLWLSK